MKKEYDFSKGERGKFYKKDISLKLPVYLDDDNLEFIQRVAEKKKTDISAIVNEIIKNIHDKEHISE
jgi:hypothetical protein